jgi:Domain of unknown function (DUF4382)
MTVVPPPRTRFARVLPAAICAAAALLGACHTSTNPPPGTPVVTMSDLTNSGDFMSYIVTIDAIELTRNDGSIVTPLATPVTVDLAGLNSMTELVEAPAVPEGTYTSGLIALDWTLGTGTTQPVWLNLNGQTLAASPETTSGTGMGTASVTVTFDPSHPLVVKQNQSVRLHVDFDLTASNWLTATSPAAVQVQPFATMSAAPVDATVMRLRGLFVTTTDVTSGFYLNSRPFYSLVSALGAVIVHTNAQTYFNINGTVYTGAAGLTAIASQQQNTPLAVYGTLDDLSGITPTFNATEVYVGISEESQLAYYLTGTVAARSDNAITLRGVDYLTPLGTTPVGLSVPAYLDSVPVTLGTGTSVFEDGIATPGLTIANVSVGQQITVAGQPTFDSTGTVITNLDATAGILRLHPTTLWGTVNADTTLDLLSLGRFAPSVMTFTGTGTSGPATPSAYVVDTSAVPAGPATTTGELLQVQGGVTPFGSAPPDFSARAVTPGPSTLQTLVVNWTAAGSTAPFTSNSSAGFIVNLADANLGTTHEIRTGPPRTPPAPTILDLKSLPASPLITTTGADQSNLQLAIGSTTQTTGISVFNSASAFANAVHSAFNGTNKIFRLVAYGQYDSANNTFVAARINVALHE